MKSTILQFFEKYWHYRTSFYSNEDNRKNEERKKYGVGIENWNTRKKVYNIQI